MSKYLYILIVILLIISCDKNNDIVDSPDDETEAQTWSWEAKEVVYNYDFTDSCSNEINIEFLNGLNYFAIKMFKTIYEDNDIENVIISPFSINVAIGMLYNGGSDGIRSQIKTALKLDALSDEEINHNFKLLFDSYRGFDEQVDIIIANSAWFNDHVTIKENYEQNLSDNFYADIYSVDLINSLNMIDSWVDFYTNGLIDNITDDLDISSITALVLLNTLCFNGSWTYKFKESNTHSRKFYSKNGNTTDYDFMHSQGLELEYFFSDSLDGVRLPYGREQTAMYLFKYKNENADNFTKYFNIENWNNILNEFWLMPEEYWEYWDGIYLPKFSLDFSVDIPQYLFSWGIPLSNYTEFCSAPISIMDANHKCVISINEAGTEAAAVTASAGGYNIPPCINFNHPFYFMIVDERNETILFQGIVNNLE